MANRQNKKGRRKFGPSFVQLYQYMLISEAWLSLRPAARAVYIELHRLYNGSNNGRLGLSVRRAAGRCRISKDTANGAFDELIERGFIAVVTKSAFSLKTRLATEYRVTCFPCDVTGALPTKDFTRWRGANQKQTAVPNQTATVINQGQEASVNDLKAA